MRRTRVFYGWWIVAAAFVAVGIIFGFRYYVFGVFVKPMAEDLGWNRGALSGLYSVAEIVEYALGLFVGRAADRYGPRGLMVVGALVAGVGFASVALVSSLWQFYILYGLVVTVGVAMAGLVPVTAVIANWFTRRRGTAMGLAISAVSVGAFVLVPLCAWIIQEWGWRLAWLLFGLLCLVVIAPVVGLVMRRRPEDLGLLPDGDVAPPGGEAAAPGRDQGWTVSAAVRTPAFWLVALVTGLAGAPLGTFAVHVLPFASDTGISPVAAAAAVSVSSLIALPGRIFYGWLADRMDKRQVMVLLQLGMLVGFGLLLQTRSAAMLYVSVAVLGLFIGGVIPVPAALLADLFGRRAIGAIFGLNTFASIFVYAAGPAATGFLFDATGSYTGGFVAMIGCLVAGSVLVCFVRRPRPRPALGELQTA